VVAVVGAIEIIIGIDVQAVRAREQPFAQLRRKLPSRSSITIG
jgi:hypothetical protein